MNKTYLIQSFLRDTQFTQPEPKKMNQIVLEPNAGAPKKVELKIKNS